MNNNNANISTDSDKINTITRGAVQIFTEESLLSRLNSGKRLKIKLGADPSRPDLHLGHTVILRKLKILQELGHEIIFVIGDFTGMIGDPTGRNKTRPKLTLEETRMSGKTYFEQVTKILDPNKTTIEYNSAWLNELNFADIINLASKYTLAQILERDDFSKRFKENIPVSLHELLYPLAQGYDSVALDADIEVGGTDQTFNLLVGRELQRNYGQIPQEVITFPLLVGLDGKEKMSKSLNNYIGIDEPPEIMFEKAMKIPDAILLDYFTLTTDLAIETAAQLIESGIINAHIEYGKEIVRMYHGEGFIESAVSRYAEIASGSIPQNIDTAIISLESLDNANSHHINICDLVRLAGLCKSNAEARRLIQGKGIKIDNSMVSDVNMIVSDPNGIILSRGKNKFVRIEIGNE